MAKTISRMSRGRQSQSKELLEARARALMEHMGTPTAAVVARQEEPSDSGDMAEHSHEEWLFLNRNAATAQQLREIKEALARLNEGTYGICAECDKPISTKRLQAVPDRKSVV